MVTSVEIKEYAINEGFSKVGIVGRRRFNSLPSGPVWDSVNLSKPMELLPSAASVIVLGFSVWHPMFNLMVAGDDAPGKRVHPQLYSTEVAQNRAWRVASLLVKKGHEAVVARSICLKRAAVIAGIGAQGKQTVVVTRDYGTSLRFAAVLTSAKLDEDEAFSEDLCGDCDRCVTACPTKALKPWEIDIHRCMVFAAENPEAVLQSNVREAEEKYIRKFTPNAFVECTICLDACPIHAAYLRRKYSQDASPQ